MELFTRPAYQNEPWLDTRMGPPDGPAVAARTQMVLESGQQAWCLRSQAPIDPEPRGKPVRFRHGPATVSGYARESDTCCRGGADAFRGGSALRPASAGRQLGS